MDCYVRDVELRQAILGLLSLRPSTGYDLGRAFAGSVAHFWYADQSQIYRTIDRLSADGAIDTERIPQDHKPDRKVHTLTDAGREEFMAWLESPLEPERHKEPFLARLFFAEPLGPDGVDSLLTERQEAAEKVLDTLRSIDATEDTWGEFLRESTLRYGITQAESELEWIAATRARNDRFRSPR